ncbi:MAG: M6 family metalloprotease domain-containing protein [Magnetococcales bacterium]|nr:M6 family metalloprotease domain-containing protein [Nitrospirota bacterium]
MLSSNGKKWLVLFVLCFALALPAMSFAVPANPDVSELEQPDGSIVMVVIGGDEWSNRVETVSGYTIGRGSDGYWYYVTGYDAANRPVLSAIHANEEPTGLSKHVSPLRGRKIAHNERRQEPLAAAPQGTFNGKVLFILVQFNDISGTYTESDFASVLTDNLKDYYYKASNDKVTLSSANESFGTANNGVVGWLTLNYNHPNTGGNTGDSNRQLARDAIVAADPYVDYASYDTNHDGYVDASELAIVVIAAGYESSYSANYTPSVWGHKWALGGSVSSPTADGVYVGDYHSGAGGYAQIGEVHQSSASNKHRATVGIIAHELGHLIFGLPDLYDKDKSSQGLGYFCLMAYGTWGMTSSDTYDGTTPVLPSAWVRSTLGWIDAYVAPSNIALTAIGDSSATASNTVYKATTSLANEYFLVENRQLQGYDRGFERWLGSSFGGLAIFHIDDNVADNNEDTHRKVDLVEADGTEDSYGESTDLWYDGNAKTFTDTSTPNSKLYDGSSSGVSITSISVKGITMTASTGDAIQYALTVTKNGTGSGTVTSSPFGISCGETCTANFDPNTLVTLTAVANSGSIFTGWSSNCYEYGMPSVCRVTMSEAKNVTATFDPLICTSYTITPTGKGFTSSGGYDTVSVTVNTGCPWTATSNNSWITITSGTSGSGNGTVAYTVSANTSASQRTGTMTIAGQTFTVTQEGQGSNSVALTISKLGKGTGTVTSSDGKINCGNTCTASYNPSDSLQITLTAVADSGSTFAGWSGDCSNYATSATCKVGMYVANSVTATFDSQTCTDYRIGPTSKTFTSSGGDDGVSVTTNTGCPWTATSNVSWITITSGTSGSGNDIVSYTVAANTSVNQRTGTMTIAGQTFTVTQEGQVSGSVDLTISNSGTGSGTVTSSDGKINCGGTCTASYTSSASTQVTLTAMADSASTFAGWSGDCTGTTSTCTVTMSAARSVTARFDKSGGNDNNTVFSHVKRDFDGDGKGDILWHNTQTGDVVIWLMNGANISTGSMVVMNVPLTWQIKATGDFNGDGKTDILWQNTENGDVVVLLMNGATISSGAYVANGIPSDWTIKAVADFNGDGKADVLWQNTTTGDVAMWLLNGMTISSGDYVVTGIPGNWQIKAVGDFDGDSKADVLWQDTASGDVAMWLLNGMTISSGNYVVRGIPANWQIKAAGDFDSDGKTDVLWQEATSGDTAMWLLNGMTIVSGNYVARGLPSNWQVLTAGDLNGDAKSDVVLQDTNNGDVYIWLMDGINITGGGFATKALALDWKTK